MLRHCVYVTRVVDRSDWLFVSVLAETGPISLRSFCGVLAASLRCGAVRYWLFNARITQGRSSTLCSDRCYGNSYYVCRYCSGCKACSSSQSSGRWAARSLVTVAKSSMSSFVRSSSAAFRNYQNRRVAKYQRCVITLGYNQGSKTKPVTSNERNL